MPLQKKTIFAKKKKKQKGNIFAGKLENLYCEFRTMNVNRKRCKVSFKDSILQGVSTTTLYYVPMVKWINSDDFSKISDKWL